VQRLSACTRSGASVNSRIGQFKPLDLLGHLIWYAMRCTDLSPFATAPCTPLSKCAAAPWPRKFQRRSDHQSPARGRAGGQFGGKPTPRAQHARGQAHGPPHTDTRFADALGSQPRTSIWRGRHATGCEPSTSCPSRRSSHPGHAALDRCLFVRPATQAPRCGGGGSGA
jgi:hypothetical protein